MLKIEPVAPDRVAVSGRLDASQVALAQTVLDGVSGSVTLDCSALEYLSSAGLGVLLKTQKRLLGNGGKLRLVGVSAHLRDIFVFSGFHHLFEIEAQA